MATVRAVSGSRRGTSSNSITNFNFINPITLEPFANWNDDFYVFNKITMPYLDIDTVIGATNVRSNNCIDLDIDLKKITEEIAKYTKLPRTSREVGYLAFVKNEITKKFNNNNCSDKIEQTVLDETVNLITENVIESEKVVLGKSDLETKIYIVLGGVILITALIILTNKNK
jgi:hypothetical protein